MLVGTMEDIVTGYYLVHNKRQQTKSDAPSSLRVMRPPRGLIKPYGWTPTSRTAACAISGVGHPRKDRCSNYQQQLYNC